LQSGVKGIANWWQKVNASPSWQENIFLGLAIAYAVIGLVALIQLIRIELRVPEYGWTTQKVFHLLNFIVNGVRAVVFCFRESVQALSPEVLQHILLDLPGLLFFTTYTLLVLFWAEIYYQARSLPTDGLRPAFLITNAAIYVFQACIWVCLWWSPSSVVLSVAKIFFAVVSLVAAFGFLLYGGRCELYSLLDWMELPVLKHVVSHFQFPFKFFHSLLFLCLLWDIEVCQSLVSWWYNTGYFLC
jgi:hypothetical protein